MARRAEPRRAAPAPLRTKDVNEAHARRRGPGERLNDELKNWKIRSSPNNTDKIIAAAQTLMIASA